MSEQELNINFDKTGDGLVPVVTQDWKTGEVLIVAFMNREAFEKTLKEGKVCYWSRNRQKLWQKGETSGNFQLVKEIRVNCEQDSLLIKVEQKGGACHDGYWTCFYRKLEKGELETVEKKVFEPKEVYGEKK